ncbi:hypothetical protein IDJ77_00750 [Mucilaginibacter sp. ZT4R22]|uniref:Uncharacterized protein n=1 Tax=Mucilaginibacter pankratovii TaxID=2772110 RepID=A0ABR7WJ26_9SPHI|nr:hypothetical protein [Mucilaginibacter pankratovii]MBD1362323.1 hypothetical protein [Mucilaginibacter pankratovii]
MSTDEIKGTDSQLTASGTAEVKITNKAGQIVIGEIDIAVNNQGAEIEIGNIFISLPCGDAATDLVVDNTEGNIVPSAGTRGWVLEPVSSVPGRFKGKAPDGAYPLEPSKSVGFTLSVITLSHLAGNAEVTVTVYPPTGNTPLATLTVTINKIIDEEARIALTTITPTVWAKQPVTLDYTGKAITRFTLSESISPWTHTDTKDGSIIRYPEKTVHYTLEGTARGIRLQTQLTVGVLPPTLKTFTLVSNLVDEGAKVLLNWDTEYAEHVILTCDDKEVPLLANYPKTGAGVEIGPIKRATTIHAQAEFNGVVSVRESHNIRIAGPRVESFNITALPLEPGKKVSFKLDWVLKNTTRFQITEHYAGQTDVHKLPVPEGVTTCTVNPTHAETTYKLEALAMSKKKPEDALIKE